MVHYKGKYVFCSVDVTIVFLQMPFSFMILIILHTFLFVMVEFCSRVL